MSANCRFQRASIFTISGFLPQISMRRMRTTAEGSSIRVMAMKLVVESPYEKFELILMVEGHVLPDIGVLSEVDLVSAEREEREVEKREREKHTVG